MLKLLLAVTACATLATSLLQLISTIWTLNPYVPLRLAADTRSHTRAENWDNAIPPPVGVPGPSNLSLDAWTTVDSHRGRSEEETSGNSSKERPLDILAIPDTSSVIDPTSIATEQRASKPSPWHVFFTTYKSPNTTLESIILENSRTALRRLPRVTLLEFTDDSSVRRNQWGYLILRDMYHVAMNRSRGASTYTYFNHDIVFNASVVDTLDALVEAAEEGKIKQRFFAVGLRTNVDWFENMTVNSPSWNFESAIKLGKRFKPDAQDFFVCSPGIWDWSQIPPFVVGRLAYDNWLVTKALKSKDITTVDISRTSPVIHQTGPSGNYAGHQQLSESQRLSNEYNRKLGKGRWHLGQISYLPKVTWWNEEGKISVVPRFNQTHR